MDNTPNSAALRAAAFAAYADANAGAPLIAVHAHQGQPDHAYIQLFKELTEVKEKLAVSDALNSSKDEQIASLYGQIRRLQSNDRGRETGEVGRLHLIPLLKNAELYGICKDMTKPVTLVGDDALTLKQRSYFSYDFVANCAAIVDSPKAE
ncbi:hypothetical protein CF327_g7198 [Tilletia walkeri]|nr:hypothetical protein CF327_g7198 [Tilletia walkeri]